MCTDGLTVIHNNPHLWMDPQLAKHYVLMVRNQLMQFDPTHADEYRANAARYNARLDALTKSIQRKIDSVPPKNRAMIVYHNAWLYYNARFGIRTLGFIEPSPGQQPNPKNIGKLVDLAKQYGLHAIFSEPEYSPKLAQQIARSAGITLVTNLYDDSLGTRPQVSNYISMLNYDTDIIVKAMR
ncbi:MAG: metal ABC transporter substrate-binding protein [Vulcanimicrobiaceae bacterium]